MPAIVWTEATRDAVDGLHLTRAGRLLVLSSITDGGTRTTSTVETSRHLTTTAARVLAAQLTAAADLIDHGPDPRETLRELRAILWPAGDPDADWSGDTLDAIGATMERAGMGRPPTMYGVYRERARSATLVSIRDDRDAAIADALRLSHANGPHLVAESVDGTIRYNDPNAPAYIARAGDWDSRSAWQPYAAPGAVVI
jgi:hypothetical protein